MTYRWFMWGLSNGVLVLAIAGGFWFGLAASTVKPSPLTGMITIIEVAVLWGGFRLRRKAKGFHLSEVKQGDQFQRRLLHEMVRGFWRLGVVEGAAVALAVGLCFALHQRDLVWPALGAIISLHFAPLARLFRLPLYYAPAALGTLACIIAVARFSGPTRTLFVGVSMGATMWLTAIYAIVRSDHLAERALATFALEASNHPVEQSA